MNGIFFMFAVISCNGDLILTATTTPLEGRRKMNPITITTFACYKTTTDCTD